jgi:hypothetical protein
MPDGGEPDTPLSPAAAEAIAAYEEATMPSQWAVIVSSELGVGSVNGVYGDPIVALCAADALDRELRYADPDVPWEVRVIPFFPPTANEPAGR